MQVLPPPSIVAALASGAARVRLAGAAAALAAAWALAACAPVAADDADAAAPAALPTVPVARVEATAVEPGRPQIGRVEAAQRVEIRPRVAGHVEAVLFKEGALVRAGQPLFLIDARTHEVAEQRAMAELELARVAERQAEAEVQRARRLLLDQAIPAQDLERRSAALAEARARSAAVEAARREATLQREFSVVRAPIGGRIGRALVTAGNYVGTGSGQAPLATIVSVAPLHVHFDVDAALAAQRPKSAAPAGWTARILDADGRREWAQVPVDFADNEVNAGTGTLRLRATLAQPDPALLPGRFVRVQLSTGSPQPALTVPEKAIGTDQNQRFVLTVAADGSVQRRPVELGGRDGERRVVTQGLDEGELVVVAGLMRVQPGMKVRPQVLLADGAKPAPPA